MSETTISWCRYTFNPWIGCSHVTDGCRNCYAETQEAVRWKRVVWGPNGTRLVTSAANWRKPIAWDRDAAERGVRERVFCASLADVFEDRAELAPHRVELFDLIRRTANLDWLLLTKRPENIATMLPHVAGGRVVYGNVWLGTTVEDERVAHRIDTLRAIPAAVRFLSVEPMIGPLDLRARLHGIDWVIVGGESGHKARRMDLAWARAVKDAARATGCAVHVKQLGAVLSRDLGDGRHRDDPAGADIARFPADLRVREFARGVA